MFRNQSSQIKVGIGDGDAVSSAVTDGPGICTGTLGADLESPGLIQLRNGTAAGTHRMDVDHRHLDRITGNAGFECQ